jgi:hypothetical protein
MRLRLIPLTAVLALAGCSKIHEQRSFTLDVGESQNLKISAPLSEQKVKVAVTSDQPVGVWIVLEKAVPGGKDDVDPETLKDGVLAQEKATKDATLSATVPGKEAYRIIVGGVTKKANVTIKIDSQ